MTTAAERKRVREEERREAIAASNTLTRITKLIEQLESIGASDENVHAAKVGALKGALDARLRLLNKYLPDLKSTEITGDDSRPLALSLSEQLRAIAGLSGAGADGRGGKDSGKAVASSAGSAD